MLSSQELGTPPPGTLIHHQAVEILLDNRILDALHRNLQQIRIRRVCEVDVNLSPFRPIEPPKPGREVFGRGVQVIVGGFVVREVVPDGLFGEFLAEKIDLVEEEDDGRSSEPGKGDDGFEEDEGFLHLILALENMSGCRSPTLFRRCGGVGRVLTAVLSSTRH